MILSPQVYGYHLPLQAPCTAHHCSVCHPVHLAPGIHCDLSVSCHTDRGALRQHLHGTGQPHIPAVRVLRGLAAAGDAPGLYHRHLRARLSGAAGAHQHHVWLHRCQALHQAAADGPGPDAAHALTPTHQGHQDAHHGSCALHGVLAAIVDTMAAGRLPGPEPAADRLPQQLPLPCGTLASLLQQWY